MILKKNRKNIADEIQFLSIFLTSIIIIAVQIVLLLVITLSMIFALRQRAETTADEAAAFLREPLYTLDDVQAKRIGEALLSSGRISEIVIVSNATGELLSASTSRCSPFISMSTRKIMYDDIYLGSVSLHFSDRELTDMVRLIIIVMTIVMITVILANIFAHKQIIKKRIMKPLQTIISGLNTIASGNYDTTIQYTKYNDVNILVSIFNDMTDKIRGKKVEMDKLNNSLEARVAQRTQQLSKSLEELNLVQEKLIENSKLSALGLMAAGMAHELNTPLGSIRTSNQILISILEKREIELPNFFKNLDHNGLTLYLDLLKIALKNNANFNIEHSNQKRELEAELKAELEWKEIPNSSEIAALLVEIGVFELKPDMIFLLKTPENEKILSQVLDVIMSRKMADIIQLAGQKAASVITNLSSYLSSDPEETNEYVNVSETIDQILALMNHILKMGIEVTKEYSSVFILGSTDKLSQVWMNIIRNAAEAMNFKGKLTIKTERKEDRVIVIFEDNGPGIPEELQDKIFESFFSTKKKKEGMGLGLGICKKIIETHQGFIDFNSKPGKTQFIINLPAAKE